MLIKMKQDYKDIYPGDIIITADDKIRMIVLLKGDQYGTLDMETGKVYFSYCDIKELLKEYDILRIVKNRKLELVER